MHVQVSALAAAGYYVIAPDMLGYGRSDKPTDAKQYALRSMVTLLCALLDNLGVTGKVVVVGHDWGAATAWAMALQTPHRVDRLVVLSVGHPGDAAVHKCRLHSAVLHSTVQCFDSALCHGKTEQLFAVAVVSACKVRRGVCSQTSCTGHLVLGYWRPTLGLLHKHHDHRGPAAGLSCSL